MGYKTIFSVLLISTLAACSNSAPKTELSLRSPEQRCLELEQRWDNAQHALIGAENRSDNSWLYHVADTFNPLTNNSDESLEVTKTQELRAREQYIAFGCMDLNKMQIESAYQVVPQVTPQVAPAVARTEPALSALEGQPSLYGTGPGYLTVPTQVSQNELAPNENLTELSFSQSFTTSPEAPEYNSPYASPPVFSQSTWQ